MVMSNEREGDVTFEIVERIGILGSFDTGWTKELNLVAWNGGAPRYDIREWSPDLSRMSRGITFEEKEMRQILGLFKRRRTGQPAEDPEETPEGFDEDKDDEFMNN